MQRPKYNDTKTHNDPQSTLQKTTDGAMRSPLIPGGELNCTEWLGRPYYNSATRCILLVINHVFLVQYPENTLLACPYNICKKDGFSP